MVVRMRGVDFQPVSGRIGAAFGVRAFALPIFFGHPIEKLGGGGARGAESFQRRRDVSFVIVKSRRECFLIVTLDQRMILDQQASEAKRAGRFTVGEMMNDLSGAPFSANRMGGQ